MEQGTLANPNINSVDRLTGKAVFIPDGQVGGYDLGSIKLHKLDLSPERESSSFAIDGNNVQSIEEITQVKPVFTLEGNQFHTAILALVWLGTRNAAATQSSGTAATFAFTAKLGQTFDIGARNITNVVVTVSAAAKTADTDFFLEANKGLIRIPEVAAGIAADASVVVTFDKPAITRDSITALNALNRNGMLKLFEMDSKSNIPKTEISMVGILSGEGPGDTDSAKEKKWSLRFAVSGQFTVLRRQA